MGARDGHIAIMVAAAKGQGLRLSADEVWRLSQDDAIATAAMNGLDEKDWPSGEDSVPPWDTIKPRRKDRVARNFFADGHPGKARAAKAQERA